MLRFLSVTFNEHAEISELDPKDRLDENIFALNRREEGSTTELDLVDVRFIASEFAATDYRAANVFFAESSEVSAMKHYGLQIPRAVLEEVVVT